MRVRVLGLAALGGLALASPATAQPGMMMGMQQAPQANQQLIGPPLPLTRHERYLMKLSSLRDKTIRTKAKDGGQLTPEHTAALQKELDDLNRQFGVTAG